MQSISFDRPFKVKIRIGLKYVSFQGLPKEAVKIFFFDGRAIKALTPSPPPSSLMVVKNFGRRKKKFFSFPEWHGLYTLSAPSLMKKKRFFAAFAPSILLGKNGLVLLTLQYSWPCRLSKGGVGP